MTDRGRWLLLHVLLPVLLAAAAAVLLGAKIRRLATTESLLAGTKAELSRFAAQTSELGAINLEVQKLERRLEET